MKHIAFVRVQTMANQTLELIALHQLCNEVFKQRINDKRVNGNRVLLKSQELIALATVSLSGAVHNERNEAEINSLDIRSDGIDT
jgi:hypothetical protein